MPQTKPDIWTQFHDQGHPTTFLEPYKGAMLEHWLRIFRQLPTGQALECLDIGTGNLPIPKILLAVPGLELSLHAIDTARINPLQIPPTPKLKFRQASIEDTGYGARQFDLVTGCYALEYAHAARAVAELMRIMKPGGSAQFVMHHPESASVIAARQALSEDVPIIVQSGIFEATQAFVEAPSETRRTQVLKIVTERLNLEEHRKYWRVGQLLSYVERSLAEPDVTRFGRWQERFMLDQQRMQALLDAVYDDKDALSGLFTDAGFMIDTIGVLCESESPGQNAHAEAGEILGWTVALTRPLEQQA